MMKFLTAAALAAVLTSPALAQTQTMTATGTHTQGQAAYPAPADEASDAYASYLSSGYGAVVVDGEVVGRDPDANVRLQLQRDPPANLD